MHIPSAAQRHALTAAVALVVFGLALNHGTYGLIPRNSVAVATWWALILGVALSLWPLARPTRQAIVTGRLLAGLAVLTALSVIWSPSAESAIDEFNRAGLYVGLFVLVVATGTQANAARWVNGLAIGISAVGLLALASRLFPGVIHAPSLDPLLGEEVTRLSYPLEYWNGLAILVALGFPLILRAAVAEPTRLLRGISVAVMPALVGVIYLTSSRTGMITAAAGTIALIAFSRQRPAVVAAGITAGLGSVAAIAILAARPQLVNGPLGSAAAESQGASAALLIIATGAVCAFFWALAGQSVARIGVGRRAKRALAALAVAVGVAGAVAIHPVEIYDNFKRPPAASSEAPPDYIESHLLSANSNGRWQVWHSALGEFARHPVLGGGAGSFEAWWAAHGSFYRQLKNAHSLYFETLAELGIGGLLLVLGLFASGLAAGLRRRRTTHGELQSIVAAIAASLVAFVVAVGADWMWEVTVVGAVGVACLGLLSGSATKPHLRLPTTRRTRLTDRRPKLRPRARVVFCVLGLVVLTAQAIPLKAEMKLRASQRSAAAGRLQPALSSALAAHRLGPWAFSPPLQVALLKEQAGDNRSARRWIARAIDHNHSDWRLWIVSARLEAKSGRMTAAARSFARAKALDPRSPIFRRR